MHVTLVAAAALQSAKHKGQLVPGVSTYLFWNKRSPHRRSILLHIPSRSRDIAEPQRLQTEDTVITI